MTHYKMLEIERTLRMEVGISMKHLIALVNLVFIVEIKDFGDTKMVRSLAILQLLSRVQEKQHVISETVGLILGLQQFSSREVRN